MALTLFAFLCCLITVALTSSSNETIASHWIGTWQVQQSSFVCDTSTCCCFSGAVNIYASGQTSELYLNGTVTGGVCNGPVKQDNVDPPHTLSVTEEFFGIDTYTFTIANSTGGLTITAIDNYHSASDSCSFELSRNTNDYLTSETSSSSSDNPPPVFTDSYLGNWLFDGTCPVNNDDCCCLMGTATIQDDPSGAQSFYVYATGSLGCRLVNSTIEEDDFPWPSKGTTSSSSTFVEGFLVNQDNYNISLTENKGVFSLTFSDTTTPICSMHATRNSPSAPQYIVFGRSASLVGTYQVESQETQEAYNYWVNWTNTVRGGIRVGSTTFPVKLIQYDDASDPTLVPLIYTHLIQVDGASALFSPFASALTAVAEQYTTGLPFIFSGSTTDSLYGKIPNAFGMTPPSSLRSNTCVQAMSTAGVKNVSVIYTLGEIFDALTATQVIQTCAKFGIALASNDSFVSGTTNFDALIKKWISLNPDLLVISATTPDPWNIVQAIRKANYWPRQVFITTASSLQSAIQAAASANLSWMTDYIVSSDTWRPDQSGTDPYFGSPAGFAAAYLAATNETAVSTYVSAFAAGYALTTAIENANSLNANDIVSALAALNITFWYGNLRFASNGAPIMNYTCVQVLDSATVTVGSNSSYVYPQPHNAPAGFYSVPNNSTTGQTGGRSASKKWIWIGFLIAIGIIAIIGVIAFFIIRRLYHVHWHPKDGSGSGAHQPVA